MHRCKIHNIKWYCSPSSILNGHSCRKCGNHKLSITKSKTLEKYVEDVKIKNPNIEVIGDYINAHTPILHRCLIDGFEWENKPNNILSGNGCPKCNGKIKKSHTEKNRQKSKYRFLCRFFFIRRSRPLFQSLLLLICFSSGKIITVVN